MSKNLAEIPIEIPRSIPVSRVFFSHSHFIMSLFLDT